MAKKFDAEQYRRLAALPKMEEVSVIDDRPHDPNAEPDEGLRVAIYECRGGNCFNQVLKACDNVPPESFGDESDAAEEDRAVGWADMIVLAGPCSPCGLPHEHVARIERWCRDNILRGTFVCVIDDSGTQNAAIVAAQIASFCCNTGAVFPGDGYICAGQSEADAMEYVAALSSMCAAARARVAR